mmetsp:Transcript_17133/g.22238  ORF Transcript_17133/g.22238 Transcript_17133/m.22238 type:complete len:271 (+) Transcript_17133:19-831(+)
MKKCCFFSKASSDLLHQARRQMFIPVPHPSLVSIENSTESFPVRRVYCVGRNYWDHALEMEKKQKAMGIDGDPREPPFFFQKPAYGAVVDTSIQNIIPYPSLTKELEFEVELVVAIGQSGHNISVEEAQQYVYALGVGCDLTRRDLQNEAKSKRRPWDAAKAFDFSAPCGPLRKVSTLPKPGAIMTLKRNHHVCQKTSLDLMIFSIAESISHLSKQVTIHAGDLIFTGTPAGVGPLVVGDSVLCSITVSDKPNAEELVPPCAFSIGTPSS